MIMRTLLSAMLLMTCLPLAALAQDVTLAPVQVTEWKAVYGQIETRNRIAARARIGGTLTELFVTEGDMVKAGQKIGMIVDDKTGYQLKAFDAQMKALPPQLDNAQAELARGEDLMERGVTTAQQLDQLRTQVDVLKSQIAAAEATERWWSSSGAGRRAGADRGPGAGCAGDGGCGGHGGRGRRPVGGGGFLPALGGAGASRGVPEGRRDDRDRHRRRRRRARLAKIYPQIENGRVIADVEVPGLPETFSTRACRSGCRSVTAGAAGAGGGDHHTHGAGFRRGDGRRGRIAERTVVPGEHRTLDGTDMVEILSGLQAGDRLVAGHE